MVAPPGSATAPASLTLVIVNAVLGKPLQTPLVQVPEFPQPGTLQSFPSIGAAWQTQNPSTSQTGDLHGRQSGMGLAGQLTALLAVDQRHVAAAIAIGRRRIHEPQATSRARIDDPLGQDGIVNAVVGRSPRDSRQA